MGLDYKRDQADEDARSKGEADPSTSRRVWFEAAVQAAGATVADAMKHLFFYAGQSNEKMMDEKPWSIVYNHLNEAESHIDAAEEAFDHYIMSHVNTGDEGGTTRSDCSYC